MEINDMVYQEVFKVEFSLFALRPKSIRKKKKIKYRERIRKLMIQTYFLSVPWEFGSWKGRSFFCFLLKTEGSVSLVVGS